MYAVFIFVFRSKETVYVYLRICLFMVFSNELHS